MTSFSSYQALALQMRCKAVNGCASIDEAREVLGANLSRLADLVRANKAFIGAGCKLVVLPEYVLTGFPMGETFPHWREKACIASDGREMDALCRIAQDNQIYLAVNAYEKEQHFENLFFQGCFLISPEGRVILRYRRMNSVFSPTPFDVWERYLEFYGESSLFPVADTPLGRMAFIASDEILFPEVARMVLMQGAEILLHPSSETYGPQPSGKDICKQARALENLAYVISANTAGITGTDLCAESADGGSRIIDYRGRILAVAGHGESLNANAEVHVSGLREARRQQGMHNLVARQKYAQYADFYASAVGASPNTLLSPYFENDHRGSSQEQFTPSRTMLLAAQREVILALEKAGRLP